MEVIKIYLGFINIVGFFAMGLDKAKAKAEAWRIPEKTLLGLAVFGGSPGVWLGMYVFRHKTKHWYFKYGVPFILFVELAVALYMFS